MNDSDTGASVAMDGDPPSTRAAEQSHCDRAAPDSGRSPTLEHPTAPDDQTRHDSALFRRRFWWSLLPAVPTLVFSPGLQDVFGLAGPRFPGSEYIPVVFGVILSFSGGWVFLTGGAAELGRRQPGTMVLASVAIIAAFGYSVAVTLGLPGEDFWWEVAAVIPLMLLGRWIAGAVVAGASDALEELIKPLPDADDLVEGDGTRSVAIALLRVGDVDRPGSLPVEGIETRRDTALPGMMTVGARGKATPTPAPIQPDRAAGWLFALAITSAVVTLVVWVILEPGNPGFVLERVVTVLVVVCPSALVLAIPQVTQIAISLGAKTGLSIRRPALEVARRVEVVLFDKTGTLTEGRQAVAEVTPSRGVTAGHLLTLAAAVEAGSEHPIATAIVEAGTGRRGVRGAIVDLPRAAERALLPGRGAQAVVDGELITVGSSRLVAERGLLIDADVQERAARRQSEGMTVVFVMSDEDVLGAIALADVIRPESADAVARLRARGVRVAMLTGDSQAVGDWVAAQLGIVEVFAEVLPADRSAVVARLQQGKTIVAMVGDGVKEAPALVQADVGIAIGAGTRVEVESADIVLASDDPRAVESALELSRITSRKMRQNLVWATAYHALGIPLAAGVTASFGFVLTPALAALLMSASIVVVAVNSRLVRRARL